MLPHEYNHQIYTKTHHQQKDDYQFIHSPEKILHLYIDTVQNALTNLERTTRLACQ